MGLGTYVWGVWVQRGESLWGGRAADSPHSPDLVLISLRAGLHLGAEPGQPLALLLSHLGLLLLGGSLQLLLQGTAKQMQVCWWDHRPSPFYT